MSSLRNLLRFLEPNLCVDLRLFRKCVWRAMVLVGLTRSRIEEIFDRRNYAKLIIRSVSAPHLLSHQGPYQLGSFFIPRVFPQKASLAANSSVRICRRRSKYGKGEKIEREATFYRHPAGIDISLRTLGVSQPVRYRRYSVGVCKNRTSILVE